MRQILPAPPGNADGQLGPPDLRLDQVSPAKADARAVDLIARLAELYAHPPQLRVRANMIASVDGAVSVDGRSRGLSGAADRVIFFLLRSLADVIVVGAGTARTERYGKARLVDTWPMLREGRAPTPPIAVITRRLDLDLNGRLFADGGPAHGSARTIVLTTQQAAEHRRAKAAMTADVIIAGEQDVSASSAIDALEGLGHRRILVEGGPTLLGQLATAQLLDELCLTISPLLEGGHAQRVTSSPKPLAPVELALGSLLEDDGFLFARYVRAS